MFHPSSILEMKVHQRISCETDICDRVSLGKNRICEQTEIAGDGMEVIEYIHNLLASEAEVKFWAFS